MKKVRLSYLLLSVFALISILAAACAPSTPEALPTDVPATDAPAPTDAPEPTDVPEPTAEPTEAPEPTAEPTEDPNMGIGTEDHPIKVLFVPSVEAGVITTGGE